MAQLKRKVRKDLIYLHFLHNNFKQHQTNSNPLNSLNNLNPPDMIFNHPVHKRVGKFTLDIKSLSGFRYVQLEPIKQRIT